MKAIIGNSTNGVPGNLIPYIGQVAIGKLEKLKVYGNDYNTPDGTGIRDYIHVQDLAIGHVATLKRLEKEKHKMLILNLGTGMGYSVLEMIRVFEGVSGTKIPYEIVERREGDVAECWASTGKAEKELNWKANHNLNRMCLDTWNYQK